MYYDYDYGSSASMAAESGMFVGIFVIAIYVLIFGGLFLFALASYIVQSLSLFSIGKRREIKNSWLAWLPVGNVWMLGCISDQYQYVVKGKVTNRRKIMLGLQLGVVVLTFVLYATMLAASFLSAMFMTESMGVLAMLLVVLCYFLVIGLAIATSIFQYMSYYDLFASCHPDRAVLYLVLGILISGALPVCLLLCFKKDLGMPPKKQAPAEEIPQEAPVAIPEETEPPAEETPAEETPATEEPTATEE